MAWTRIAAAALLLALATPSHALFSPGNVGLPTGDPSIDPGDFTPPPPPPPPPALAITQVGLTTIDLVVRAPAGRTSALSKQPPGGAFAAWQSFSAGTETPVRDAGLRVGQQYCYRLDVTGGGLPDESHTSCATTDWRVGFEGLHLTQAESGSVLALFDWRDTQALPTGSEDAPALYYMNLLIEGGDPLAEQGFRSMGMHVQPGPLFPEELDGWTEAETIAQDCGLAPVLEPVAVARAVRPGALGGLVGSCTPVGRWFYAAVPGRVYNEVRARMLDQIASGKGAGIRALVFRRIPVPAALATGVSRHVLNYTYLGQQGFEFNAISQCYVGSDGVRYCQTQQEILGWLARKLVYWVVELGDEVIEGVQSAIGRIERLVKGEVTLDLTFRLLNTDPGFGTDQVMRSGWSGEEIKLAGVGVEVRQGLAGFFGETDANGHVKLTVAKNSDTKVCLKLENSTAEITEFLIETTVCVKSLGKLGGDRVETVDVRHDYVNALAAMTDARRYLKQVADYDMPKLTVLVGGNAMLLSPSGRSFAPCMGRVPSALGLGADILGLLGSLLTPGAVVVTSSVEFLTSVDVVLLPGDDGSRGVPVHEYGHAVMCDLLLDQGIDAFELAWTDVISQTASQGPSDQASYLNEGFADFVAAQVVGGTNYFAAPGSVKSEQINYCPAGAACLEDNAADTSQFTGQVQRVVTTLLDAFDGPDGVATANDGSDWQVASTPFAYQGGSNDSNRSDESIVLPMSDLRALFQHWDDRGELLREDNFFGGLADLAESEGYAEADVCALFALHDPSAACPGYVARRPWLDWYGSGTGDLLAAFAAAPAPQAPGSNDPTGGAAHPDAQQPALMLAIANAAADPGGAPAPEGQPDDACADCSRVVVLGGVQKLALAGAGKAQRDTAFAFRLGAGAFEGIDPLGQLWSGGWDARDARGAKLRLHVGPDATADLERLLAASAQDLGVDASSIRVSGPAKIELRLAKGGALVGKIVVRFEAQTGGRTRRGSYVAKLLGAQA